MECNIRAVVPVAAFFFGRNGDERREREKEGWMDGCMDGGDGDGDIGDRDGGR